MKLKSVKISEIMQQKDYGEQLDGIIVFSNLGKKDMDLMTLEQFGQLDKTNYQSELDITRGGDETDDPNIPLDLTICKEVDLTGVKLENLPLEDIDLSRYKQKRVQFVKGVSEEQWEAFINNLKHTKQPIEIQNEDEGFLGEFYIGNGTIDPIKTKYPDGHPKFDTPLNENTQFDMEIHGCNIIYHNETPNKIEEENINDIKTLFGFTAIPEINLKFRVQRTTKEIAELQHQLSEIRSGKRKKLPAKLFDKLEYHNFRDNNKKKSLFIASLKDDTLYQFEE